MNSGVGAAPRACVFLCGEALKSACNGFQMQYEVVSCLSSTRDTLRNGLLSEHLAVSLSSNQPSYVILPHSSTAQLILSEYVRSSHAEPRDVSRDARFSATSLTNAKFSGPFAFSNTLTAAKHHTSIFRHRVPQSRKCAEFSLVISMFQQTYFTVFHAAEN